MAAKMAEEVHFLRLSFQAASTSRASVRSQWRLNGFKSKARYRRHEVAASLQHCHRQSATPSALRCIAAYVSTNGQ